MNIRKVVQWKISSPLQMLERTEKRVGPNTIDLWEAHREQASLWRILAILVLPATLLSLGIMFLVWFAGDIRVEIPPKPEVPYYKVDQVPDKEFIAIASQVTSLLSSYRAYEARRQFEYARQFLWEPALKQFTLQWLGQELPLIEQTQRSQVFYASPHQIKIEREKNFVWVRYPGTRQKFLGNELNSKDEIIWWFRMTTIPRNIHNNYGIVINDIKVERSNLRKLAWDDASQARQEEKEKRKKSKR